MSGDVTSLLAAWRQGDAEARDRLVRIVYPELRALADRQLRGERANHTLQPTALVNEAYLRLSGLQRIDWQDRAHFVRMAARLMREILVDHARRRDAAKRDGGQRVTLTGLELPAEEAPVDVIALDGALARLELLDPDKARLVELRYFGGLTIEETAEAMGSSPATVKRQWQAARAWLFHALSTAG
ncbi:sigma-70 family RNA polymerase sigma factor [Arenimonas sp. MALMAid1274]|uniref:sigma-70 family RNA polymerase sigma factor n=1 Tax=Arenimonas sp. MALMAid1274 TaxID=3411630 RepID=UPI003BA3CB30